MAIPICVTPITDKSETFPLFAVILRWFSAGGFPGWETGIFFGLKALTLPAISLALPQASILARVMRSSLIDTLNEDFIKTARAKGLSYNHCLTIS